MRQPRLITPLTSWTCPLPQNKRAGRGVWCEQGKICATVRAGLCKAVKKIYSDGYVLY